MVHEEYHVTSPLRPFTARHYFQPAAKGCTCRYLLKMRSLVGLKISLAPLSDFFDAIGPIHYFIPVKRRAEAKRTAGALGTVELCLCLCLSVCRVCGCAGQTLRPSGTALLTPTISRAASPRPQRDHSPPAKTVTVLRRWATTLALGLFKFKFLFNLNFHLLEPHIFGADEAMVVFMAKQPRTVARPITIATLIRLSLSRAGT